MSGREGRGSRVIQSSSQEQWGCVKWKHKQNEPRQDGGQPHQHRDQSLLAEATLTGITVATSRKLVASCLNWQGSGGMTHDFPHVCFCVLVFLGGGGAEGVGLFACFLTLFPSPVWPNMATSPEIPSPYRSMPGPVSYLYVCEDGVKGVKWSLELPFIEARGIRYL